MSDNSSVANARHDSDSQRESESYIKITDRNGRSVYLEESSLVVEEVSDRYAEDYVALANDYTLNMETPPGEEGPAKPWKEDVTSRAKLGDPPEMWGWAVDDEAGFDGPIEDYLRKRNYKEEPV